MAVLQVFDPPMCCSTGICGPKVNPTLTRFAADLEWLKGQGVTIHRFNLAHEPGAFANNPVVQQTLEEIGPLCLPLILVDGRAVSRGVYPSREELAAFVGTASPQSAQMGREAPSPLRLIVPRKRSTGNGGCGRSGCCG